MGKKAVVSFLLIAALLCAGCLDGKVDPDYKVSNVAHERTPLGDLEPHLREAVIQGKTVMEDEGLGENGLSCASCHPNPELNRVWPALFPRRWASTMNPEHRVISLAQHNYGAYKGMMEGDLGPDDPSFSDLNIYLMWLGDGTVIWGREAPGGTLVKDAISRGSALYNKPVGEKGAACADCHGEGSMTGAASVFPRYIPRYGGVFILDTFLVRHSNDTMGWELGLESRELADLSAFLTNHSRGYVITLEKG